MVYYLHFAYGGSGIHLLDSGALLQTNIGSKTSNLTGNSLHAFLALNNCAIDVIDALDNIGHGVHICNDSRCTYRGPKTTTFRHWEVSKGQLIDHYTTSWWLFRALNALKSPAYYVHQVLITYGCLYLLSKELQQHVLSLKVLCKCTMVWVFVVCMFLTCGVSLLAHIDSSDGWEKQGKASNDQKGDN